MNEDDSCKAAVHRIREQAHQQSARSVPSANTAAYCKARNRLDTKDLSEMFYSGAGSVEKGMPRKFGRALIAVDGTTFTMPDTEENQEVWPQSSEQKEGLGFPLMKMVGAFSVDSRALLDMETGNKHDHELTLLRNLEESLQPGDILAMDRAYCSYSDLAGYQRKRIDVVVRNHQACREIPTSEALRIVADNDKWVEWKKPKKRPGHLTAEGWAEVPETMKVRQITLRVDVPGFRSQTIVLITTLKEEEYATE